ncbi:hypothetical protein NDU88_000347 [Pleurodeles waltl]|uniref:Uncharacterized protein n=1 Tax=Pleurodeles waltl TaxID=8319 RepID=A0AAV7MHN8_PLEWA|nr:hypothetical protein NDU88_000347 [Pleurodeles waltl]
MVSSVTSNDGFLTFAAVTPGLRLSQLRHEAWLSHEMGDMRYTLTTPARARETNSRQSSRRHMHAHNELHILLPSVKRHYNAVSYSTDVSLSPIPGRGRTHAKAYRAPQLKHVGVREYA